MELEKFNTYVQVVKILMEKDLLDLIWRKQSGRVRASKKVEEELIRIGQSLELDEPIDKEEFFTAAHKVMSICRDIAVGLAPEENTEEFESVAKEILNQDLISKINIQLTSKFDVLSEVETEILTKRSESNPLEVITHTAGLTFYTTDVFEDDVINQQTIELSIKELEDLIEKLNKTVDSLKTLNTKDVNDGVLSSVK